MRTFKLTPAFAVNSLLASMLGSVVLPVNAELFDRGGGLIYDDVLDVTWMQDVNYAKTSGDDEDGRFSWDGAMNWTANLVYYDSVRDVTWSNWRLPKALPVNGVDYDDTFNYNGTTDNGYNISSTASELGYMFYVNLGIKAYADVNGNWPVDGFGFKGDLSGPFDRMLGAATFPYWTSAEYPPFDGMAYVVVFKTGSQHGAVKESELLPWPVMDGDVAVIPSPSPEIIINSPQPGAVVSGSALLQATPQNGNVKSVTYVIGGVVACGAGTAPFECSWDSAALPNGMYALRTVTIGFDDARTIDLIDIEVAN